MDKFLEAIAWTVLVLAIAFITLMIFTDWSAMKKCEMRKSHGTCVYTIR